MVILEKNIKLTKTFAGTSGQGCTRVASKEKKILERGDLLGYGHFRRKKNPPIHTTSPLFYLAYNKNLLKVNICIF